MRRLGRLLDALLEQQPPGCDAVLLPERAPALAAWDPERFRHVAVLQDAARNHGKIEVAEDLLQGRLVAVKAMPMWWACGSHSEFVAAHPKENELPWRDIAITDYFSHARGQAFVCESVGVFRRDSRACGAEVCFVLTYCSGGDLLGWLARSLADSQAHREAKSQPLLLGIFRAVGGMHEVGIAHGDLSLENVLLAETETPGASSSAEAVRLVDFGASTGPRAIGPRGKPSYQAPEMHTGEEYDALAADAFALGVLLFTLVTGNYPWRSTRPHLCPCFRFFRTRGMVAYLEQRTLERGGCKAVPLAEILSEDAVALLSGLLAVDVAARWTVAAALAHPWLSEEVVSPGWPGQRPGRWQESCWHGFWQALGRHRLAGEKGELLRLS